MATPPRPVTMLAVEIDGFGRSGNPGRLAARERLYTVLATAFDRARVSWRGCAREDRGGGMLIVVPAAVPKPTVLDGVLTALVAALREPAGDVLRLRIAGHAGDIHHDGRGFVGIAVSEVAVLVDAAPLRHALDRTTAACAILLSDVLYDATVRQGYGDLDPTAYHPVAVGEREARTRAWLRVPGENGIAAALSDAEPFSEHRLVAEQDATGGGVWIGTRGGRTTVRRATIIGGNATFGGEQRRRRRLF